jgi:hypothetical protein
VASKNISSYIFRKNNGGLICRRNNIGTNITRGRGGVNGSRLRSTLFECWPALNDWKAPVIASRASRPAGLYPCSPSPHMLRISDRKEAAWNRTTLPASRPGQLSSCGCTMSGMRWISRWWSGWRRSETDHRRRECVSRAWSRRRSRTASRRWASRSVSCGCHFRMAAR